MQRRAIINQLKEEGITLTVTKFKSYLQRLGYPQSGNHEFDEGQVQEIKGTIRGDQQDQAVAQAKARTPNLSQVQEQAEGAIATALHTRVSGIGAGIQAFDAQLVAFEEQAATVIVDRLNTSEARIMALVEGKLTGGSRNPGPEADFNLGLLVEEAMVLPALTGVEPPDVMAYAVGALGTA